MRLALGCVLVLPAVLHLLLCHTPTAAAAADVDTHNDARHPTPLPPLDPPRHTRHDPVLGLGLLGGLPRLLSLTSQDTPLSSQLLGALNLNPMHRQYPSGSLAPLPNSLQRAAALQSFQDLRNIGSFPMNDLELLQVLLDGPDGGFGRRRGSSVAVTGRGESCRDQMSSEDTMCPSTLLQILRGRLPLTSVDPVPTRRTPVFPLMALPPSPWLKAPPSKRYLGIELPDYIATSYSSIKTDNAHYLTKLHQLKQRMRNAGK